LETNRANRVKTETVKKPDRDATETVMKPNCSETEALQNRIVLKPNRSETEPLQNRTGRKPNQGWVGDCQGGVASTRGLPVPGGYQSKSVSDHRVGKCKWDDQAQISTYKTYICGYYLGIFFCIFIVQQWMRQIQTKYPNTTKIQKIYPNNTQIIPKYYRNTKIIPK
jgi:hypothetical protein